VGVAVLGGFRGLEWALQKVVFFLANLDKFTGLIKM